MVGSDYYLSYVSPQDGKADSIASDHQKYKLEKNLQVTGSDGTAVMTGHFCRVIHILEKPLQLSTCLLHCNELPWRHVFRLLDGVNWS